jgi:hypothetical protein
MSVFNFFKKDMKILFFFIIHIMMVTILFLNLKKNDTIFFDIFFSLDNKKGKKGKLFFLKYFVSIHANK